MCHQVCTNCSELNPEEKFFAELFVSSKCPNGKHAVL